MARLPRPAEGGFRISLARGSVMGDRSVRIRGEGVGGARYRLALGRVHAARRRGQTARNAMQRELTATLGTVGATHVRFLFGFPFALVFLAGVLVAPARRCRAAACILALGVARRAAQIVATALMLAAMNDRSFVVTIAYIKTEPMQVALFGLVFLGDAVTPAWWPRS